MNRPAKWCYGLAVLALASQTFGEPTAPYTLYDFNKKLLGAHRSSQLGAYRELGVHDPKWDDDVLHALDLACVAYAGAGALAYDVPEPVAPAAERLKACRKALAAGCNDPLLLMATAAILHDSQDSREYCELYEKAGRALAAPNSPYVKYPPMQRLRIATHYLETADPEERPRALQLIDEAFVDLLATPKLDPTTREVVWFLITALLNSSPLPDVARRLDAAEKREGVDPWLLAVARGTFEVKCAYVARGNAPAGNTRPQQFQSMSAHLKLARKHLTKAIEIDPTHPSPMVSMIDVELSAGDEPLKAALGWFAKATALQSDSRTAYSSIFNLLRPRWHGSVEGLYAFSLDCAAKAPTDPAAARMYLMGLDFLAEEVGPDALLNGRLFPNLMENVGAVLDADIALARKRGNAKPDDEYALLASYAWRAGDWQTACEALEQSDRPSSDWAFDRWSVFGDEAASEAYARSGPHADELAAVMKAPTNAGWTTLLAKFAPADKGRFFVEVRQHEQVVNDTLLAGKTYALPTTDFSALSPDWHVRRGAWTAKDGVITGKIEGYYGYEMVLRAKLPRNYEFCGTVAEGKRNYTGFLTYAIGAAWTANNTGSGYQFTNSTSTCNLMMGGGLMRSVPWEVAKSVDFRAIVLAERNVLLINEDELVMKFLNPAVSPAFRVSLGGVTGGLQGTAYRFSKLELRPRKENGE